MFSEIIPKYRAGIEIAVNSQKWVYTLDFFMGEFVAYAEAYAAQIQPYIRQAEPIPIRDIEELFNVSQSISTGRGRPEQQQEPWKFDISNRTIECQEGGNCYVSDPELTALYPEYFTNANGISYLEMARFLHDKMQENAVSDVDVAKVIIDIMHGKTIDFNHLKVIPIMIAALFIAEARRNPACFIPSLMLLDLIRNGVQTPFGDIYSFDNALQNPILVNQGRSFDIYRDSICPYLVGTPGSVKLASGVKVALDDEQKAILNAAKKHNGIKNQRQIQPSEFLMQLGGYFPNTHRFSYKELQTKRKNQETTLSDIKSFAIICDWLTLKGVAKPIDKFELHRYPYKKDEDHEVLREVIFPQLFQRMSQLLQGEELQFNLSSCNTTEINNTRDEINSMQTSLTNINPPNTFCNDMSNLIDRFNLEVAEAVKFPMVSFIPQFNRNTMLNKLKEILPISEEKKLTREYNKMM